jgi:hypothetical protein
MPIGTAHVDNPSETLCGMLNGDALSNSAGSNFTRPIGAAKRRDSKFCVDGKLDHILAIHLDKLCTHGSWKISGSRAHGPPHGCHLRLEILIADSPKVANGQTCGAEPMLCRRPFGANGTDVLLSEEISRL